MPVAVAKKAATKVHALLLDPVQSHNLTEASLRRETDWQLTLVTDLTEFSQHLQQQTVDIVLISSSDLHACNQGFMDITNQQPQAVRILLHTNKTLPTSLAHLAELAHYCLNAHEAIRPFAQNSLQLVKLNRLVHKSKTADYVNSLGKLPSPPDIYQELSLALSSDKSNAKQISKIISKDPALAAKVLKVVNSAYFGLGRSISSIQEAVSLLGIRTLRALSISGQLLDQYPQHRNWSYFSFESINKRAVLVARLAQEICMDLELDTNLCDQAFIGGLLHDLGMLIFASQDSDSYRKIMVQSAQTGKHLCIIERQMLGVFHGEIAAFLLSHWKLPPAVTEAVLLHHTPQLSISREITPLTAVHIADCLLPEVTTEIGAHIGNTLSRGYVSRLGLENRLDAWNDQAVKLFNQAELGR